MKKLLVIFVLGLLLSGNVYAEIINLACKSSDFKNPLNIILDTKNETASYEGSNPDPYHLENGIFRFVMQDKDMKYRYAYSLNRNTGVLAIKGYQFSEEQMQTIYAEVALKMISEGKTTDDKSYLVKLIIDRYNEGQPLETFYLDCEKIKKKF